MGAECIEAIYKRWDVMLEGFGLETVGKREGWLYDHYRRYSDYEVGLNADGVLRLCHPDYDILVDVRDRYNPVVYNRLYAQDYRVLFNRTEGSVISVYDREWRCRNQAEEFNKYVADINNIQPHEYGILKLKYGLTKEMLTIPDVLNGEVF